MDHLSFSGILGAVVCVHRVFPACVGFTMLAERQICSSPRPRYWNRLNSCKSATVWRMGSDSLDLLNPTHLQLIEYIVFVVAMVDYDCRLS